MPVAAHKPEAREQPGQLQTRLHVVLRGPGQRGPQVVVLALDVREPRALLTSIKVRLGLTDEFQAPAEVTPALRGGFARFFQALAREIVYRFQQTMADLAIRHVRDDQGFVDEM